MWPPEYHESTETFTFIDKDARDAAEIDGTGQFSLAPPPDEMWISIPGNRDRGGRAHMAFADGHVGAHTWKQWPKARGEPHATLDREDLHWRQERLVGEVW